MNRPPGSPPRIWVLLGKGAGGNGQMLALAEALGWPYETRQLVHNPLNITPNLLLGASRLSVNRRASDALQPPWPDVVIAASRRSAPVACWIRKQSGGHTRLVHLLHTQAPLHWFDLIITTPQYRLPVRPNILHNTGPLNIGPSTRALAAGDDQVARWHALPRPWVAVLMGGNSSSYRLDTGTAAALARQARQEAGAGTLLISTSPRTPTDAAEALAQALQGPHHCYRWQPNDPDNPYPTYLALADRFIVTADSASLMVEACATGKPVRVFDWPRQPANIWQRLGLTPPGWATRVHEHLVYLGLLKPARDFAAYHAALRARGLVTTLGKPQAENGRQPLDDMERAIKRIRLLMGAETAATDNPRWAYPHEVDSRDSV